MTNPTCTCNSNAGSSECSIAIRCKEPLAWSITPAEVKDQGASILYTLVPREIRDMIFTYALADTTSQPGDRQIYRKSRRNDLLYRSDIAFGLLSTCKAVYVEAYNLPLRINPFVLAGLNLWMKKHSLHSWQIAQIAQLNITLQQPMLEKAGLIRALSKWKAHARNQRCYLVPQEAVLPKGVDKKLDDCPMSLGNILIPAATTKITDKRPQLITDVLRDAQIPEAVVQPCFSHLRVSLASPLTHLTLCLQAHGWLDWSEPPNSRRKSRKLRLDPTFFPSAHLEGYPHQMHELAIERRMGRHPELSPKCWGAQVASLLPDLQVFELVLETFAPKVNQLDNVAACATTWKLEVEEDSLVWDGEIVKRRWQKEPTELESPEDAEWYDRCRDFEIRVVRYVRKRK